MKIIQKRQKKRTKKKRKRKTRPVKKKNEGLEFYRSVDYC
jgi:hypothetical protein